MKKIMLLTLLSVNILFSNNNQTDDVSPVLVDQPLPFKITVETADFTIPGGIHSGASARCGSNYLFIAGRTNGLHGFNDNDDNFPPTQQNTNVFVVNTYTKTVYSRSLHDPSSGLTQEQIDTLSVTSPQSYQSGNTLYITGGYGVETSTGNFSTKDTLTAISVSDLIEWVINPQDSDPASCSIRQISNPVFQVTGGAMFQTGQCPTLLIFGQNFIGFYNTSANGLYTKQVRKFFIVDDGQHLDVIVKESTEPDSNFRRRDLNIIPIIKTDCCRKVPAYVALSGVFTLDTGIWTVPVEITADGTPSMANPDHKSTFKQGMNNYASAHVELLSRCGSIYSVVFGGLTFGFFKDGTFKTDSSVPFTNQITAIKRNKCGEYKQFLLPVEYPVILSTQSNPGSRLLFGAGAFFIKAPNMPVFPNGVLNLAKIRKQTVIGYIVGGIQSTKANTSSITDSAASPHIFKVTLRPTCC